MLFSLLRTLDVALSIIWYFTLEDTTADGDTDKDEDFVFVENKSKHLPGPYNTNSAPSCARVKVPSKRVPSEYRIIPTCPAGPPG